MIDGPNVGNFDGALDGSAVGALVGSIVGNNVGSSVGVDVGSRLGDIVGRRLGRFDGWIVGSLDGNNVGTAVGRSVGTELGGRVYSTIMLEVSGERAALAVAFVFTVILMAVAFELDASEAKTVVKFPLLTADDMSEEKELVKLAALWFVRKIERGVIIVRFRSAER